MWRSIAKHNLAAGLRQQSGFISLFTLIFGMVLIALSNAMVISVKEQQLDTREAAYFAQVKDKAETCLETVLPMQNWFYTAAPGANYDALIIGLCGLPTAKSIQYQLSNVISKNNVSFRTLAYWIGPYSKQDATIFNRISGVLTLDPIAINGDTISSYQRDWRNLIHANEQMRQIAHVHQLRFNTLYNTSGDAGFNFFRASACAAVSAGEVPCSDTAMGGTGGWKDINTINNAVVFSDMTPYSNVWGLPITYCNTSECGASLTSPFTILFSTSTPWGSSISISAMQNI
jgi:hypothetical protein